MLDIHSHIIPKIDDGSDSMETSIDMLKIASKDNYKKIIATPHYYRGYYENSYTYVSNLVKELNQKVLENNIGMEVLPGQEVFLDKHTINLYKEGVINGLNGTKYLLIEFPMNNPSENVLDYIYELSLQGVIPIIAHPERYRYVIEKPYYMNNLLQENCLFQINTGSIKGIFGKKVKKTSEILIKHGFCNFIASDAHTTGKRCPGLKEALDIVKSIDKNLENKIDINTQNLLENKNIEKDFEKIKQKKSIFSFFRK
jgi:protein-tyrosine phosphatase